MLKIVSAEFLKGAITLEQFPQIGVPEFAFFGRSNAGKSSLINMLLGRKQLVKTGSRPGMTREITFFIVNRDAAKKTCGKTFCVADLPGYGFAQVSDTVRNRIDRMLYAYCTARPELKTVFFLMDIRRDPTETERNTLGFFKEQGIETVLTATKTDKISKNEQLKRLTSLAAFFERSQENIVLTSASKNAGREQLLNHIAGYLEA